MVAGKNIRMLVEAILDYLKWIKSVEEHKGASLNIRYTRVLIEFLIFAIRKDIAWKEMFTLDTVEAFGKHSGFKNASRALSALCGYLFSLGRIDQPLGLPKPKKHSQLPDIYEHYLAYHEQSRQVCGVHLSQVRTTLACFHNYLERHSIALCKLKIEHLDTFMAEFKVAETTRKTYRHQLRGLLKYLYHEREILKRDLAPLLVGPPLFAQSKPPKFLRPQELQKLFADLKLSTPTHIRTYAMIHLAFTLGLRPIEITKITLDDISFSKAELTITERKGHNPITLPIPEKTLKAIAVYLKKARPKSLSRHLFVSFQFPYKQISPGIVTGYISKAMKHAGLSSSAYWLRHTYAQSLLQIGQSIYEVKEMMGHQNIQSTQRYLHINTRLMRKVLFDEEL
jgi:site-specific recombinase XerD